MIIDPTLVLNGQSNREPLPRDAVARALRALDQGDSDAALAMFEYALRLAPSDLAIAVSVGDLRLALGDPSAAEAFELVAARTDWREAWLRLAMVRTRFTGAASGAPDLRLALSRFAPSPHPAFHGLAGEIAEASGAPGWCGLDSSGCVTLGGAVRQLAERDFTIAVDGNAIRLQRLTHQKETSVRQFRILDEWRDGIHLTVNAKGSRLIGSPISIQQITRIEGFVHNDMGGLTGWCWLPGDPGAIPEVIVASVSNPQQRIKLRAEELETKHGPFADFSAPRRFAVAAQDIAALGGSVVVSGPQGRSLYGSPICPMDETDSATSAARAIARQFPAVTGSDRPASGGAFERCIPIGLPGPKPHHPKPVDVRRVVVVIPVYRGLEATLACIDSVRAAQSADEEILVIVDDSPEQMLISRLKKLAAAGTIQLEIRPDNKGFPATANVGLMRAAAQGCDAILLNSDTLVAPGWIATLRQAIYSHDNDIGTATPLSNAATIFSYPDLGVVNPVPDLDDTVRLARLAREVNGSAIVDVPTGHGFCLYVRLECLLDTGLLREDVFAQGYGEENDFCMRARHLGWRHVAATGTFVAHAEGQSFAAAKQHLMLRNIDILNRLHPGYDQFVAAWQDSAPLARTRREMDMARWRADQGQRSAVVLVTHNRAGGVLKYVRERAQARENDNQRAIIVQPQEDRLPRPSVAVTAANGQTYPNLLFQAPAELPDLLGFLRECRVEQIELHHFIGHDPEVFAGITTLGPPYDVHVHDYGWFCPRVTLTGRENHYCGEPDTAACRDCVADNGSNIDEEISPDDLIARSKRLFDGARAVIAPSNDAATRIARRFDVKVGLGVWQDETSRLRLRPVLRPQGSVRRICLAGAISYEKGYNLVLQCARLVAAKRLPLEFVLVGFTCDDSRLLATGCVRITGRYEEHEAGALIQRQKADFAFLPALWPETWSYVLTRFWDAGLPVVAFDIGAPAERILRRHGGLILPVNLPVERLLQVFLDPTLFQSSNDKTPARRRALAVQ